MLGFPLPYCDELIYSTIARYGVHSGITSPKELLFEVFGDTKITAVSDLPGHLKKVAELYPEPLGIAPLDLLYKHTLFPLYAPFIGKARHKALSHELVGSRKSSVHLMAGVIASRVKQPKYLRYCPDCVIEQFERHGECYWRRIWQVAGADSCPSHGKLIDAKICRHDVHRHAFKAASPDTCPSVKAQSGSWQDVVMAISIDELLGLRVKHVPELTQWGIYYKNLAAEKGFNRGLQVRHEEIKERVIEYWGAEWLAGHSLLPTTDAESWLQSIFRKHRKAFSYLEHLIVLHALLEPRWNLQDAINEVVQGKAVKGAPKSLPVQNEDKSEAHRSKWLVALNKYGVKAARLNGFGSVYTWLYRHDKVWLMEVNQKHYKPTTRRKARVDWSMRDSNTLRVLVKLRDQFDNQLNGPRRSKNWYLKKIDVAASVEKHLELLPLCRAFLKRHSESISDYQIRRIKCTLLGLKQHGASIKRWRVLRAAGLSEERLTEPARCFLMGVLRN
ncbi:Tn7-like transposition protein D [Pseudovibrio sp. FO-BEG1]|uniref:TnsD family Tn7-like transposition protein n=1 Tax=Pseudovibrio sp. (strain FO-BEG1) TaxID=911045 RepID=UPI000238C89C|nr:TnsD family Tn7-like transposition protein [Pseudovibrio sp. FO-BEG1]AEV37849.1 Tn7-like transposition protein D [Pseudovibrio sp. FO-BEG1]